RKTSADVAHVLLQNPVVVHAHLTAHFGVLLPADGDFLVLAHQRELSLSRGGIGGAAAEEKRSGDDDRPRRQQPFAADDPHTCARCVCAASATSSAARSSALN